jgi:hypothetical protein
MTAVPSMMTVRQAIGSSMTSDRGLLDVPELGATQ